MPKATVLYHESRHRAIKHSVETVYHSLTVDLLIFYCFLPTRSQTVKNGLVTPDKKILPLSTSCTTVVAPGKTSPSASSNTFSVSHPSIPLRILHTVLGATNPSGSSNALSELHDFGIPAAQRSPFRSCERLSIGISISMKLTCSSRRSTPDRYTLIPPMEAEGTKILLAAASRWRPLGNFWPVMTVRQEVGEPQ